MARNEEDGVERFVVREPAREVTFRAVVVVVVILLLTNLLIIVYFVHPYFNPDDGDVREPEDPGDWLLPVDQDEIADRDVRFNWNGTLERPIVVRNGGELVIRDSHLKVYMQDLMFWLRPAFDVEEGGGLFILDSTVEIYREPMLDRVVFGPYMRPDNNFPFIARTVNLDEAVDPVLHLDVQWLGEMTPVAVGVIPEGEEDIVLLDYVEGPGSNTRVWTHGEVSLADYGGTRPWVIIWFDSLPSYPILVGNLSVMDGDSWPAGDAFPTGHPVKDGWGISRFYDLPYIQRGVFPGYNYRGLERTWQPLIDSVGEVSLTRSRVEAPPGTEHLTRPDILKEQIHPLAYMPVDQVGSHRGNIRVNGGSLNFFGCEVVNVPVSGRNVSVSGLDSIFSGEADLISLFRSNAGFNDCTFITEDLPRDHRYLDPGHRYIWAVGLEGNLTEEPSFIINCDFQNSLMGIEATRANLGVDECNFTGTRGMAIWDHMSTFLNGWEFLSEENTFEDSGHYLYLRTTVTDVEFYHSQWNSSDIKVHSGVSIESGVDLTSPFTGELKSFNGSRGRYIIPELLVLGNGVEQTSSGVLTEVRWEGDHEYFMIPPKTSAMRVDLEELFAPDPHPTGLAAPMDLFAFEPSAGKDVYQLMVGITDTSHLQVSEPTMRFTVNGELIVERNLTEDDFVLDDIFIWENLTLPGGWQDINVTVWGKEWLGGKNYSDEPVLVDSLSIPMLIMADGLAVEPWMPLVASSVIVPENVTATIDGLETSYMGNEWLEVRLAGWEGSSLTVDCTGLPSSAAIRFVLNADLSLEVVNLSAMALELSDVGDSEWGFSQGGGVAVRGIDVSSLVVSAFNRPLTISQVSVTNYLYLNTYFNTSITITDSVFERADVILNAGYMCDLVVRNCSFDSAFMQGVMVSVSNANVTVEDCTIEDSALMIFLDNWYEGMWAGINVTGCEFYGDESVLYVGWNILRVDSYDMDAGFVAPVNGTIEGNVFTGPGTHVVLAHGLYGRLWGDNQLVDGARLDVFYITRLQVIPPDDTPINNAYAFIPVEGFTTDWPFQVYRWVELDGEILWDVTDDPLVENDPPTLEVLLFSKWGAGRIVRGFDQVVPNADNDEGTYPTFPDFDEAIRGTLVHWPPLVVQG